MKQTTLSLAALAALLALPAHAVTTIGDVDLGEIAGLSGTTTFATWNNLQGNASTGGLANGGSFFSPGAPASWGPYGSQGAGDTDDTTQLIKISNGAGGGPYAASASIYYGSFGGVVNTYGGTLALSSTSPLENLQTVIFQIQIGEAWGYDFYNGVLPTLTYTVEGDATEYSLTAADFSLYNQYDNGTVTMPTGEETVYINTYALWWDFSEVEEQIASFEISWDGVEHAQLYGVSIQQSDEALTSSILPAAVPEPSALLLSGLGLLGCLRRRR